MFESMIIALLVGIGSGIVSSAPIGPTDFWIAQLIFSKTDQSHKRILAFILGVICADLIYLYIAFMGYAAILNKMGMPAVLLLGGSILLIVLGFSDLHLARQKPKTKTPLDHSKNNALFWDFIFGMTLSAANPGFILFWVFTAGVLNHAGIPITGFNTAMVSFGVILGDLVWYGGLAYFLQRTAESLSGAWATRARICTAASLIIFGLIGLYEFITLTVGEKYG